MNALVYLIPCPLSTVSTHNLKTTTLKDALGSQLFRDIRDGKLFEDDEGPYSLVFHQADLLRIPERVKSHI